MGWAVGTFALSMATWVLIPTLALGWQPFAVESDSMRPLLRTGDVVLVDPEASVETGEVIAFETGGATVIHRAVTVADGVVTTRGDANQRADSTPVDIDDVRGAGRLLVPYIGLAKIARWGWLVLLGPSIAGVAFNWRRRPAIAAAFVIAGIGVGWLTVGSAAFATAESNGANSLAAVDVAPPTNLNAACGPVGGVTADVDLTWTASATPGLTGYAVYYDEASAGTNYTEVGTTSSLVTSFTHQITVSGLSIGTHTYVIRAEAGPWQSEDSTSDSVSIAQIVLTYVCTES